MAATADVGLEPHILDMIYDIRPVNLDALPRNCSKLKAC